MLFLSSFLSLSHIDLELLPHSASISLEHGTRLLGLPLGPLHALHCTAHSHLLCSTHQCSTCTLVLSVSILMYEHNQLYLHYPLSTAIRCKDLSSFYVREPSLQCKQPSKQQHLETTPYEDATAICRMMIINIKLLRASRHKYLRTTRHEGENKTQMRGGRMVQSQMKAD